MMMIAMTREETAAYGRDGYILRSGLLSREEVERFRDTARAQLERENREGAVMSKGDKDGKTTLLKMWTKAEDDQYGLLARDERLVDLPLQPQDDDEAAPGGRRVGMAPGFRLLVQLRLPRARNDEHLCRARQVDEGKRLPSASEELAQARSPQSHS